MATGTQIVQPEDITIEFLEELFDAAYMRVSRKDDGVLLTEDFKVYVEPQGEGKRLSLTVLFGLRESAPLEERFDFVNRINDSLIVVRAYVTGTARDALVLDYYVSVEGGVTARSLVYAVKTFQQLVKAALNKDENNLLD